jgi:hypothetical protein
MASYRPPQAIGRHLAVRDAAIAAAAKSGAPAVAAAAAAAPPPPIAAATPIASGLVSLGALRAVRGVLRCVCDIGVLGL